MVSYTKQNSILKLAQFIEEFLYSCLSYIVIFPNAINQKNLFTFCPEKIIFIQSSIRIIVISHLEVSCGSPSYQYLSLCFLFQINKYNMIHLVLS